MAAALALSERGRGRTAPNPNVGCVIVQDDRVVGRGWTQPGGRPHAEAMALAQAGAKSRGATCYVTLEPCAHVSERGPACADLLIEAGVAGVVIALGDPDPRTNGQGITRLRAAGIEVAEGVGEASAREAMAGFLTRRAKGRPFVTLKLATSLDGRIALESGESRWITGPQARAHAHLERARHDAILVGRGTRAMDTPSLDVRLPGLEDRTPRRFLLTGQPGAGDDAWGIVNAPSSIADLEGVDHLLVEGGAETAASFLREGLVDRLLLYRAPILIGAGKPALGDIGLSDLATAHNRWRLADTRMLGSDRLEVYASQ
ncbi:bifunctional diaminohydroxyphosphoribosylaminopyrimidine deaminase/5-amino-6-(5-phosphoribosylamino)uracil reductase RibD [Sphingomonas sp. M1-B02]|uniref:bifunctional diaminohydroxyphosphoribosylaminopyrimidine deaminase/5-amino-6-(5-phosphoribosylamino)uracil reductase RibD n=1 Tax=Sphingomonas sp. M1-B02 TaxID=3114300 RepID=UPI00223F7D35|nr:bifunctional diaminohydroxyphosphoribosylaminopyrimidine deaminase/5-amino-6-(5-phosphoribosylamino)uracil reductase RibD [Sphingomonas sp. S6-11]UZK67972.1 bifunctional diaminohydroxyphosphoribosylaminopyrimidine deaminase/5-amino-6-(5-phosphoribosylamino)uracil reductase RibD [Sphingomonas sp. S6-11]